MLVIFALYDHAVLVRISRVESCGGEDDDDDILLYYYFVRARAERCCILTFLVMFSTGEFDFQSLESLAYNHTYIYKMN